MAIILQFKQRPKPVVIEKILFDMMYGSLYDPFYWVHVWKEATSWLTLNPFIAKSATSG